MFFYSNKIFLEALLSVVLTIVIVVPYSSSALAGNPCDAPDEYLDTGIGGTGYSQDRASNPFGRGNGVGGTGLIKGSYDEGNGIGGTGVQDGEGTNGIGGTGDKLSEGSVIYVTGTIHAFGSVCVNGVEIEYSQSTPVSIDTNEDINSLGLKIGQVVDVLTDGGFDQVAAGEEDAAGLLHDEGLVAHDGQVGAARHAAAHDGGDLRDAHGAHHGVVEKCGRSAPCRGRSRPAWAGTPRRCPPGR